MSENGEDDKDRRILARAKSNIGPDDGGFKFDIAQAEPLPGIYASFIAWGESVAGSARELLAEPEAQSQDDSNDACELLRAELTADTWTNSDLACRPLKDAGFSKKQIWVASKKLDVIRKKGGMREGWYWRLPGLSDATRQTTGAEGSAREDSAEGSEGSKISDGESSESSGHLESSEQAAAAPDAEDVELF